MGTRFRDYRKRIVDEVRKSFSENNSPREIAFSFATGIFIATMPTMGLGLILFIILIKASDRMNAVAMFSSTVFMNPFIKPVFYLASINVGSLILFQRLVNTTDPVLLIKMLYLGSLVIASLTAIVSYFIVLGAVQKYRASEMDLIDDLEEELVEELQG